MTSASAIKPRDNADDEDDDDETDQETEGVAGSEAEAGKDLVFELMQGLVIHLDSPDHFQPPVPGYGSKGSSTMSV